MSMSITRLGLPAERAVTDLIVRANPGFSLPPADMVFGIPWSTGGRTVNCLVESNHNIVGLQVEGGVVLSYERLDLGQYFQGTSPALDGSGGTDASTLLNSLLNRYQLYFTNDATGTNGYSQAVVTYNLLTYPVIATITPTPGNLVWQGSMQFVINWQPSLLTIFPNVDLVLFGQPGPLAAGQTYAETYYGTTFNTTGNVALILALVPGLVPVQTDGTPWALGVAITIDPWVYNATTPGPFNIAGATVTYNGPAVGDWALAPNLPYENVCVITLGPDCTNLVGSLIIPYNIGYVAPAAPTPITAV